jgi:hypothetical protein
MDLAMQRASYVHERVEASSDLLLPSSVHWGSRVNVVLLVTLNISTLLASGAGGP